MKPSLAAAFFSARTVGPGASESRHPSSLAPLAARFACEGLDDSLEEALIRTCDAAAAQWPAVTLDRSEFAAHLGQRSDPDLPAAEALSKLHSGDLYLALAAAAGDQAALREIEQRFFPELERARLGAADQRADAAQILREKLFVCKEGRPPKIAEYAGAAPLVVWLRIAALRTLQNVVTRAPKERPLEETFLEHAPDLAADPELAHMRRIYRAEFERAFKDGVLAIGAKDRALLQQRFSEGRTQEELAAAYAVHVNTIARWIARARQALEIQVRSALTQRLNVSAEELESIFRLVGSQLDLTMGGKKG